MQFKGSLHNAHATIAQKPGAAVPVGVWEIQSADELRLDQYEGYPHYYFKQTLAGTLGGKPFRGWPTSWIRKWSLAIRPPATTTPSCRQGYRDCGLDPEVLRQAVLDSGEQTRQPEYGGVKLC